MITLTLPYCPSVNHYKRAGRLTTTKNGKIFQPRVNTEATNRYFYEVWFKVQHLKASEGFIGFGSATISVEVDVYPPDNRKRDLSNILKVLEDSMQKAGVYDDDYNIARLLVTRRDIIKGGQIIVRIEELQMPSENQLAQQAAARALSIKNNSTYPDEKIPMVNTDNAPNSDKPVQSTDVKMYTK